jgi:hypothetical protein
MVQAAFWRGEIQKQQDPVSAFFQDGEGTLLRKLTGRYKTQLLGHINNIEDNPTVKHEFDKNLSGRVSNANYHTNYFEVKSILNELSVGEGQYQQSISRILELMERGLPKETRRRKKLIRGTEDPKKLNEEEKVRFAKIHLDGFRQEVREIRIIPSGYRVYGDNMKKHLMALSKVRGILEKIMDNEPVSNAPNARRRGETYISSLGDTQTIGNEIYNILNREINIVLPEDFVTLEEWTPELNQTTVTVFEALDKLNHYYQIITITNKKDREKLLANLMDIPAMEEKDILRSRELEKKLFIPRRAAERLVELEHDFVDNRENFKNTPDSVKLREEYDTIKEEFLRVASTGQGGENKAEEAWQNLLVGLPHETRETRVRRIDTARRAEGEVRPGVHITREPSPEAQPLTYESEAEREAREDDN